MHPVAEKIFYKTLIFIYLIRRNEVVHNLKIGSKLINMSQNIFFYVAVNCNLAIEFNGLVSIKGCQK